MFQPKIPNTTLISRQHKNLKWHRRLGHVSHGKISKTLPVVKGVNLGGASERHPGVCKDCAESKSCRNHSPLATPESRASTGVLDLVHVDIVGPVNSSSIENKKYFIPLYDDSSAVSLVRFLWTRDEPGSAIKQMILELETQRKSRVKVLHISVYSGESVRRLRADNAKEFLSGKF